MKTIKLFSLLATSALLTMSMGFPTELTEVEATKKSEVKIMTVSEAKPGKALLVEAVEDEPILESIPLTSTFDKITVKVFDVKGALVLTKQVAMNDFLANNKQIELAGNCTFVMFHANTAYYFLEAATN
jgi:hypothetical protein